MKPAKISPMGDTRKMAFRKFIESGQRAQEAVDQIIEAERVRAATDAKARHKP
jgi:hypothetical protein